MAKYEYLTDAVTTFIKDAGLKSLADVVASGKKSLEDWCVLIIEKREEYKVQNKPLPRNNEASALKLKYE
jgi:hypothetical protein